MLFLEEKLTGADIVSKEYKKIVRRILKNRIVKNTCFNLANECLKKTKINQHEIENILKESGFEKIREDLFNTIMSKL